MLNLRHATGIASRAGRLVRGQMRFSTLGIHSLPKAVVECDYAVRGAVLQRADELEAEISQGSSGLPFDQVVRCNIGNLQAAGQEPILFHRQMLACLLEPSLASDTTRFPEDVRERASLYLSGINDGRVGAYSQSQGHRIFREEVADFLTGRDAAETDADDVFLTDGTSAAIKLVMQMVIRGPEDGVLLPIPQYPLYSAILRLLGGQSVGYYLDEEAGWTTPLEELERAVSEFRASGGSPRAMVVINPGNPTGHILTREVMKGVLEFAEREGLMVFADEVHQDNVHIDEKTWCSFRQLAQELGTTVEVFSLHSCSTGVAGACAFRGGFLHCENLGAAVRDQLCKLASINLGSSVLGQALMASVLRHPPRDGPSRSKYDSQLELMKSSLKRKSLLVAERLNAIDGITCQPIEGALYAFPRVIIKGYTMKKAISFATPADKIYCLEMVERTGIATVPGSGFGQRPGHFHFGMTIMQEEQTLMKVLDGLEKFHSEHAYGWFK